jgi:hypothetical protein
VSRWTEPGKGNRLLLSVVRRHRLKALLMRLLDETEFLSDYGARSVSKAHAAKPFVLDYHGARFTADYEPGESTSNLFGGNSNWRGPVWMPINFLIIEALYEFDRFYGDDFTVECPSGSGKFARMSEVAEEISRRLCRLFLRDGEGRRAVQGGRTELQEDPRFKDLVPFHEYFHGENGRGLGASHQTGWTGLVALLIQPRLPALDGMMPVAHSVAPTLSPG